MCWLSSVLVPAAVVTLDSIEIFTTHEWFPMKPTVYFRCNGENRTVLPDVKEKHVVYTFKGVESWQVKWWIWFLKKGLWGLREWGSCKILVHDFSYGCSLIMFGFELFAGKTRSNILKELDLLLTQLYALVEELERWKYFVL